MDRILIGLIVIGLSVLANFLSTIIGGIPMLLSGYREGKRIYRFCYPTRVGLFNGY